MNEDAKNVLGIIAAMVAAPLVMFLILSPMVHIANIVEGHELSGYLGVASWLMLLISFIASEDGCIGEWNGLIGLVEDRLGERAPK